MRPRAKQLRQIARKNQNKHYWWAVLVTLVAMVLGCAAYSVPSLPTNFNFEVSLPNTTGYQYGFSTTAWLENYFPMIAVLTSIAAIYSLIILFIAGPTRWGYVRYCLQMHDGDCHRPFATLFSGSRSLSIVKMLSGTLASLPPRSGSIIMAGIFLFASSP